MSKSEGRRKWESEGERRGEGRNDCCCGPVSRRVWKVGLDLNVVEELLLKKEESTSERGRLVGGTLVDNKSGAGRRGDLREPLVKGSDPVLSVEEGVVVGLRGKALWIVVIMGICAPNAIEGWRRLGIRKKKKKGGERGGSG